MRGENADEGGRGADYEHDYDYEHEHEHEDEDEFEQDCDFGDELRGMRGTMNTCLRHDEYYRCFTLLVLLATLPADHVSGEIRREIAWRVDSAEGFAGLNELRDGKTGKTQGIVACDVGEGLVCFSPAGKVLWRVPMTAPVTASPAVFDFTADGREEIVACDGGGNLYLLDDAGNLLWKARTRARVQAESCPAVADLDDDGHPEIIVGDISGAVHCFDHQGKLRWLFAAEGDQMGPVLIADLYRLPGREIVVTSHNGHIYALSADGNYLWDLNHPHEVLPGSTPVLSDVEGNGIPRIHVGGGLHHFLGIDPIQPAIVTQENVHLHVNNAICTADLDLDGNDEVVFGNKGGKVFCFGKGGLRWTHGFHDTSMSSPPLVLNMDDDPDLEVLFLFHGMKILKADGSVMAEMPGPLYNAAPLAGDFDGDGYLDVALAGSGLMQGSGLAVYRWSVSYQENPAQLTAYAGNRAHSGVRQSAKPFVPLAGPRLQDKATVASGAILREAAARRILSGENRWKYIVDGKATSRWTLLSRITYPDGSDRQFAHHGRPAEKMVTLAFDAGGPGEYLVNTRLVDPDRRALLLESDETLAFRGTDSDAENIRAILSDSHRSLDTWGKVNPRSARVLRDAMETISGRLAVMTGAAALDPSLPPQERWSRLRGDAERIRKLAAGGATRAISGSIAVWPSGPWSYFHPLESLPPEDPPAAGAPSPKISRRLCIGEYDSVALNVTNFTEHPLDVRVFADDFQSGERSYPASEHLQLRRAVLVPTLRGEMVADALPTLDQGSLLPIAQLQTGQLWLTLDARGLAPGDYTTILHLKTVEPDETHVEVPLQLQVVDLALPRPRPLRFCVWSMAQNWPEYMLNDLVEHGVTVHFGTNPVGKCDEAGNLVGEIDFREHDASVKRFSPHGMLLFIGSQNSLQGQPLFSPAWKKGYIAYLRNWVRRLRGLGVGYDGFALYPYDEPSTPHAQTTRDLVEVARVIREADPNIMIYTDPTSGTDQESLEMLQGLIDVWCPSAELLERFGEQIIPFAKEHGKETWFYDASGRARTLSTLGIYRWRFWHAWNLGLTGAGWWAYKYDVDLWQGRTDGGDHYYHVYEAPGQVVTSRRWEAAREGIEDYELMYLWREAITQAEKRGVARDQVARSRRLFENLPQRIEQALHSTGRRLPLDPDGAVHYEHVTEELDEARRQIIDECLRLNGLHADP